MRRGEHYGHSSARSQNTHRQPQIYIRLKEDDLLPVAAQKEILEASKAVFPEPVKILKRKKTPAGYLTGYPADTDNTHDHLLRPDVRPCRHSGPCTSSCECVRNQVTCEKACACPPNCPRKWRGCSCRRGGRPCSTDKCICKKANRECDPDLCGTCGAVELLDPVNRHNPKIATSDMCQLVNLQREVTRKTLLGISVLSGYGLWVCEDIPKNGYIGEYKGEIITNGESERRGRLYDVRAMSFLFTLNSAQVIDATRMGNKFRFVNNSQMKPNCYAKVLLANCAHRIGFFALRPIRAGEELFFDYGYVFSFVFPLSLSDLSFNAIQLSQGEPEMGQVRPAGTTSTSQRNAVRRGGERTRSKTIKPVKDAS